MAQLTEDAKSAERLVADAAADAARKAEVEVAVQMECNRVELEAAIMAMQDMVAEDSLGKFAVRSNIRTHPGGCTLPRSYLAV